MDQDTIPAEAPEVSADDDVAADAATEQDADPYEGVDSLDGDPDTEDADPDDDGEDGKDEGDHEEDPEESEEVELKVGGTVKKFPKGTSLDDVRDEVQHFVDSAERSYTQKFQEVAEQRKALEAKQQTLDQFGTLNDEVVNKYAHGMTLRQELERLQNVDLNRLWHEAPDKARQVSDAIQAKKAEFERTVQTVAQAEQQLSAAQQEARGKAIEEGKARVERLSPGFSARADEVVKYAVETYGIPEDQAKNWALNPETAVMAEKAMKYDRLRAKGATKPKPKQTEPAKPVRSMRGKGGGNPSNDPEKMTTEQYAAWRAKGGGM